MAIDAPGYELVPRNGTVKVTGDSAYIVIRPKPAELTGYIRSDTGEPIAGARVSTAGSSAQTDASGFFKLTVPGAGPRESLAMQVSAVGFATWNSQVVPGANEIAIVLNRTRTKRGNP